MKLKQWQYKYDIKPISANKLWYKAKQITKEYRQWREDIAYNTPDSHKVWPFNDTEQLEVSIQAGFSSKLADVDNVCKPVLDTWQNLYNFNDRYVYKITAEKEIVKKGKEYLDVTFRRYNK